MQFIFRSRAEWRAVVGAALIGSGLGLGLGAVYIVGGMGRHAAEYAEARELARAAVEGYEGVTVEPITVAVTTTGKRELRVRNRDLTCLTDAVYYEARSESVRGQRAVAQVVLNRVKHPAFPKTICGVVFQGSRRHGCQFSFACDGSMRARLEKDAWAEARKVAARALAGAVAREVGSATHYHTVAVSPAWRAEMARVSQVGDHVFYRFSPRKAALARAAAAQKALLTSAPLRAAELRITPALLEAPAPTPTAAPSAEPAAAEATQLKTPEPVAGAS